MVADLPVGDNFQDHVLVDAIAGLLDPGMSINFRKLNSMSELLRQQATGRCKFIVSYMCTCIYVARGRNCT